MKNVPVNFADIFLCICYNMPAGVCGRSRACAFGKNGYGAVPLTAEEA